MDSQSNSSDSFDDTSDLGQSNEDSSVINDSGSRIDESNYSIQKSIDESSDDKTSSGDETAESPAPAQNKISQHKQKSNVGHEDDESSDDKTSSGDETAESPAPAQKKISQHKQKSNVGHEDDESSDDKMSSGDETAESPAPAQKKISQQKPNVGQEDDSPVVIRDASLVDSPVAFVARRVPPIIDSDSEDEQDSDDVVDISSGEEFSPVTPKRQLTLPEMLKEKPLTPNRNVNGPQAPAVDCLKVSRTQFEEQQQKVQTLQTDLRKIEGLCNTINKDALPDKGVMLHKKLNGLKEAVFVAEQRLKKMVVDDDLTPTASALPKQFAWDNLKVMAESVQPKTFGKRALETINNEKTLTLDRLQQLHSSLTTCPTEDTLAEEPRDLKVKLMPHQKYALAWLLWREGQKPSGGILADDMGLGKTLTMISLMLASRQLDKKSSGVSSEDDSDSENQPQKKFKLDGGTLVVCPASLLGQWESEVEKHCKRYSVSVELYHGAKRETNAKRLARHDMVITTYTICAKEYEKHSALYGVRWRRIILDEAHQIRNHKSNMSIAACLLRGKSRWALTGTPVHNKELDMYSLLKFLRCTPFDDLQIWKRWIGNMNTGGQDRIQTVISSIMLRRTKAELQEKGALQGLPDRSIEVISIKLQAEEQVIYHKILVFSRTLFAQYLHQQTEKKSEYVSLGQYSKLANNANSVYYQMHQKLVRLNKVQEVQSHQILVLLLRLRQMCCHPSLIVKMLQGDQLLADEDIAGEEEFNILEEMKRLNINENTGESIDSNDTALEAFHGSVKDLLDPENPIFSDERKSTKIEAVLKLLREKILPTKEKVIIVSQWTGFLRLLGMHLGELNVSFEQLDGSVAVPKRMGMVENFNDPRHPTKVLLLSLTAGGVGLNLVGANHMILLDLHWNPQLEMQAQDRIYRVGQKREVHIYKLVATNTIEERIKALQEHKLNLADSMLTGSKMQHMKLSLQDLRMLFSM